MEEVLEIVGILIAAGLSAVLAVAGVLVEVAAIGALEQGEMVLGAWEGTVGLILILGGLYVLGYQRVWPTINERFRQYGD